MTLAECTLEQAPEILAILNEAIVNSTALYDYHPRSPVAMETWFEAKLKGGFPVIGAFDDDHTLMGFFSLGTFRGWPAYKYTVEHSVYVHTNCRGQGVGKTLLRAAIEAAQRLQFHMMIGAIDSTNAVSIKLHQKLGFTQCAHIRQAGFKFGRWLDVDFYQLILSTPIAPRDG